MRSRIVSCAKFAMPAAFIAAVLMAPAAHAATITPNTFTDDNTANGNRARGDAGKDKVRGGSGKDNLNGGAGKDKLFGGGGKDKLKGGGGKDKASGCERRKKIP